MNLCGENDRQPLCVSNPIKSSVDTCKTTKDKHVVSHTSLVGYLDPAESYRLYTGWLYLYVLYQVVLVQFRAID